jgi:hypothetical protein
MRKNPFLIYPRLAVLTLMAAAVFTSLTCPRFSLDIDMAVVKAIQVRSMLSRF